MAPATRHITVIQRAPTYFGTGANSNELVDTLRELDVDETWIHEIVRGKVLHDQQAVTRLSFEEPELAAHRAVNGIKAHLPANQPVEEHFSPSYRPWQQRLAVGARRVTPQLRREGAEMPILSWIDPENFNPNYLMRSLHLLPHRGDKPEWMHTQDYWTEKDAVPTADLDEGCLRFK